MAEYYDRSVYDHLEVINKMNMYLPKGYVSLGIRGGRLTYKQFIAQQSLANFRIKFMKSYLSYFFEIGFCRYPAIKPRETGVYKVLVEGVGKREELYLSFDFWDSNKQKWSWFDNDYLMRHSLWRFKDKANSYDKIIAFQDND